MRESTARQYENAKWFQNSRISIERGAERKQNYLAGNNWEIYKIIKFRVKFILRSSFAHIQQSDEFRIMVACIHILFVLIFHYRAAINFFGVLSCLFFQSRHTKTALWLTQFVNGSIKTVFDMYCTMAMDCSVKSNLIPTNF